MFRNYAAMVVLSACSASAPLAEEVNTQEFIFSQSNGKSFSLVLPADWQPYVEGGFLRISPRNRVLAMDVIMIRPITQLDVRGLQRVRLARRLGPTSGSGEYDLWVEAGRQDILGSNHTLDFFKMAPQTWLRPNEFRLVLER
ncbi:MAG: hypothetical protein ABI432_05575 [Flavobacteriales bacterium]